MINSFDIENLWYDDNYYKFYIMNREKSMNNIIFRNTLKKYHDFDEINRTFPEFVSQDKRLFYDTIYTIEVEPNVKYVNSNKACMCNTILVCCNKKCFNIFFDYLDSEYNNTLIRCDSDLLDYIYNR